MQSCNKNICANNPAITMSEKVLLSLLANELFECPLPDTTCVDWEEVYEIGCRQAVVPLLYPALKHIKTVPKEVLNRVRNAAIYSAGLMECMLENQQEITHMIGSKQIPWAVLKGMSIACRYPHPELRQPGDIDLLVNYTDLQEMCNAIENAGYEFTHNTDLHYCYCKGNIAVEIHHTVSIFEDTEKGNFTRKLMGSALKYVQYAELNNVSFPVLVGIYQLISLLAHMERHLTASGIGLRQLCDWAITVEAYRDQIGNEELATLNQCGLLEFAKVSTKLCEKYLGLPPFEWCADVSEGIVDSLLLDLFARGNFHATKKVSPFTDAMTDAHNADDNRRYSTLRSYLKYVRNRVREEHPRKKSPLWVAIFAIFYPLRWTLRMLLGQRKKFDLKQSVRDAKKREEMIKELKLYR